MVKFFIKFVEIPLLGLITLVVVSVVVTYLEKDSVDPKDFLMKKIEDSDQEILLLKERLKEYANTCLSDMLIFSDFLYQLLEAGDEIDLIFDELFSEAEDEDL